VDLEKLEGVALGMKGEGKGAERFMGVHLIKLTEVLPERENAGRRRRVTKKPGS